MTIVRRRRGPVPGQQDYLVFLLRNPGQRHPVLPAALAAPGSSISRVTFVVRAAVLDHLFLQDLRLLRLWFFSHCQRC